MASGTPVVARWVPGMDEEFDFTTEWDPCLWYYGTDDRVGLLSSVMSLLESPVLRQRIGQTGRAEIMRRHTWFHRILSVLPLVEEIRAESCMRTTDAG
jgi:glycosyltransferase involved in cell wall biosynthesis